MTNLKEKSFSILQKVLNIEIYGEILSLDLTRATAFLFNNLYLMFGTIKLGKTTLPVLKYFRIRINDNFQITKRKELI